jgi:CBS domain-containing protein
VRPQVLRVHLHADDPPPQVAPWRAAVGDFVALLESAAFGQPFFVASYSQCCSRLQTREVKCCMADEPLDDVFRVMSSHQIRRMPVVDQQQHFLGMLSLGDIATQVHGAHVA